MADSINIKKLAFDPEDGLANTTSFPDPANEAETREQLMRLHLQIQEYLNTDLYKVLQTLAAATGDEQAIQTILTQIENVQKEVDELSNKFHSHPVAYGNPAVFTSSTGTTDLEFNGAHKIYDSDYISFDSDSNAFVVEKEGDYKFSFSIDWTSQSTSRYICGNGVTIVDSSGNVSRYISRSEGYATFTSTYIGLLHLSVGYKIKPCYASNGSMTGIGRRCVIEIVGEGL